MRGGDHEESADHVEHAPLGDGFSDGTAVTRRGGRCVRLDDRGCWSHFFAASTQHSSSNLRASGHSQRAGGLRPGHSISHRALKRIDDIVVIMVM